MNNYNSISIEYEYKDNKFFLTIFFKTLKFRDSKTFVSARYIFIYNAIERAKR